MCRHIRNFPGLQHNQKMPNFCFSLGSNALHNSQRNTI
jgi:hypothetical protein